MKSILLLTCLLPVVVTATPPTDPTLVDRVDRSYKKFPNFYSQTPTCALAVIGKDPTNQSWIIFDLKRLGERKLGGYIYVDLNGDGDLTQANEKIQLTKPNGSSYRTDEYKFTDAENKPNGYAIQFVAADYGEEDEPLHYRIFVTTPTGDRFGAWGDQNSDLIPTRKTKSAPVLHFDGPRQMGFEVPSPLGKRGNDWRLCAGVGTYGLGDGSFVYQFYKTIPKDVHPTASISWPAKKKGDPPLVSKFILKDRC